MGKISCECGYIHSNTCGYDGDLFKEGEWDIQDEIIRNNLSPINIFECCNCGNLMIDDPKDSTLMITYIPKNSKYNKILHNKIPY